MITITDNNKIEKNTSCYCKNLHSENFSIKTIIIQLKKTTFNIKNYCIHLF